MEQRIADQEEEIRKQDDTIQRLVREVTLLGQRSNFYRSEREFFKKTLCEVVPMIQLPDRPRSP